MPDEPEVHSLVALMEIPASRIPARLDPDGLPVPLPEQNRGRWDHLLIRRGFTGLGRHVEAVGKFRRAAALTMNGPERTVLLRRPDDCEARG